MSKKHNILSKELASEHKLKFSDGNETVYNTGNP